MVGAVIASAAMGWTSSAASAGEAYVLLRGSSPRLAEVRSVSPEGVTVVFWGEREPRRLEAETVIGLIPAPEQPASAGPGGGEAEAGSGRVGWWLRLADGQWLWGTWPESAAPDGRRVVARTLAGRVVLEAERLASVTRGDLPAPVAPSPGPLERVTLRSGEVLEGFVAAWDASGATLVLADAAEPVRAPRAGIRSIARSVAGGESESIEPATWVTLRDGQRWRVRSAVFEGGRWSLAPTWGKPPSRAGAPGEDGETFEAPFHAVAAWWSERGVVRGEALDVEVESVAAGALWGGGSDGTAR